MPNFSEYLLHAYKPQNGVNVHADVFYSFLLLFQPNRNLM